MSRIVVVVTDTPDVSRTVSALRRFAALPVSEAASRIKARTPILEWDLFGNDHDEVAEKLRALMDEVPSSGAQIKLFELPERRAFRSVDEEKPQEISPATLRNILAAHDEGIAELEQREEGD
jgi:hypothetical protein